MLGDDQPLKLGPSVCWRLEKDGKVGMLEFSGQGLAAIRDVLRPHGHAPTWVKGKPGQMTSESRAALKAIDLHFHDLRREFACTLLESSADLHDVRDFLGHANITTTSRYLASSPDRLARALARMEGRDDSIRTTFAQTGPDAGPTGGDVSRKSLN